MPVYEFKCLNRKCVNYHQPVELQKKITEADQVERCGSCDKEMIKIISSTNFILKGGGWYARP